MRTLPTDSGEENSRQRAQQVPRPPIKDSVEDNDSALTAGTSQKSLSSHKWLCQ